MTKIPEAKSPTFVGLKEFRRNVSKYAKRAKTNAEKVIVTSHNKPLFMVTPLDDELYTTAVLQAVAQAKEDLAAGRVYSLQTVKDELGFLISDLGLP